MNAGGKQQRTDGDRCDRLESRCEDEQTGLSSSQRCETWK